MASAPNATLAKSLPYAALLAGLLLFPDAALTGRDLGLNLWYFLHGAPGLSAFGLPASGEEVLSPPVRAALALLRKQKITSFRCAGTLCANDETNQRIAESAFPIQLDPAAHHAIQLANEPLPPSCAVLREGNGIVLLQCR